MRNQSVMEYAFQIQVKGTMSETAKKIEALSNATMCKKIKAGKIIKGAMKTTTNTFERTVSKSEIGSDLQKIILLSFRSSKNVPRL